MLPPIIFNLVKMAESKAEYPTIGVRFSPSMKEAVDEYLELGIHLTYSDLIRDAVREKIKREAPELYKENFAETEKEVIGE